MSKASSMVGTLSATILPTGESPRSVIVNMSRSRTTCQLAVVSLRSRLIRMAIAILTLLGMSPERSQLLTVDSATPRARANLRCQPRPYRRRNTARMDGTSISSLSSVVNWRSETSDRVTLLHATNYFLLYIGIIVQYIQISYPLIRNM